MTRNGNEKRFASLLRALLDDQRGAVAAYVAVTSLFLIGVGAFAIDFGRLYTLDTELQAVADSRALAGAAELDGSLDAITRATAAAERRDAGGLVENEQTFAEGGRQVETTNVRFFFQLPPDNLRLDDPAVDKFVTTDPAEANFIEVTVETKTLNNTLILAVGGPPSTDLFAMSVAGVEEVVCEVPGMMICNPAEPGALGADESFDLDTPGRQIVAKRKAGGSNFWAPGDFGLLDTPDGCTGTDCIREYLAQVQQEINPLCFNSNVDIRPGVADAVRQGINVRFDMYLGPMKAGRYRKDANFRPGRDTIKGLKRPKSFIDPDTGELVTPGPCDYENADVPAPGELPEAMGFPRDKNLIGTEDRFGNGVWDFAAYWQVNHPNDVWPGPANPTRHQVYVYETKNGLVPDGSTHYGDPPGTIEDGKVNVTGAGPSCYDGPDACFSPYQPGCEGALLDRREFVLAVINCQAEGIKGNEDNVRVVEWKKMFLTEPLGDAGPGGGPDTDMILETIGPLGASDDFLHREIVIYRGLQDIE